MAADISGDGLLLHPLDKFNLARRVAASVVSRFVRPAPVSRGPTFLQVPQRYINTILPEGFHGRMLLLHPPGNSSLTRQAAAAIVAALRASSVRLFSGPTFRQVFKSVVIIGRAEGSTTICAAAPGPAFTVVAGE